MKSLVFWLSFANFVSGLLPHSPKSQIEEHSEVHNFGQLAKAHLFNGRRLSEKVSKISTPAPEINGKEEHQQSNINIF
jgi:hypothetical protein